MDRMKTMERLKKRAEFLAVAGGARASRRGFVLQKRDPKSGEASRAPRFGFTVTKKMGNSPERNRIRRRLREAVRLAGLDHAVAGTDYVLVGRRAALSQPFEVLTADLISSMQYLTRQPAGERAPKSRPGESRPINEPARSPGAVDTTPNVSRPHAESLD
ncbi:ribonuclease P protein component [Kaistia dalseonensis]|uniref:Ribonuclease P protein component n=1 Tax=Kaistia dalseonensis TaxID=410840 RepID=A0ABU0HAT3_9HYPH|nr:ribonuclease P protein component [Kaistia dalseonensis]MCX5496353.1 ribonuclease P protein component [Kaistia dalseonensis]MDQ0438973.1 ribonuclease P protein component [Kaistia dalseonensis]